MSEEEFSHMSILKTDPPPDAFPDGWIMHKSRSQPGYAYYYNQYTEETRWDLPIVSNLEGLKETIQSLTKSTEKEARSILKKNADGQHGAPPSSSSSSSASPSKDSASDKLSKAKVPPSASAESRKRPRGDREEHRKRDSPDKKSRSTEKVRVLHILKKHNKSRRPASWRKSKITISKEEAIEELNELISILDESMGDAKELRATFEELAKEESDCTSAKRGGDVGFFGRKKMQPNFEKASFGLAIGGLSGIVETSSGVHVILRLG